MDLQTVNGMRLPEEYKTFLKQTSVMAGEDTLFLEGSLFALFDANGDGSPELLIRCRMEGRADSLGDIYIFILIQDQVTYAGKIEIAEADRITQASSDGSIFTFRPESWFNEVQSGFSWNGYRGVVFTENIYIGVFIIVIPAGPAYTGISLTEDEKKVFADFLADGDWIRCRRPDCMYSDAGITGYTFTLADVTGDGHEELVVQGYNEYDPGNGNDRVRSLSDLYFYRAEAGDVVLIGGFPASNPYSSPGYSSTLHKAYSFQKDPANPLVYILIYAFDGTAADYEDRNSAYTDLNGHVVRSFRHLYIGNGLEWEIDGEQVSSETFAEEFQNMLGAPIPRYVGDPKRDGYNAVIEWDGYEPFDLVENNWENRLRLLGYEGNLD